MAGGWNVCNAFWIALKFWKHFVISNIGKNNKILRQPCKFLYKNEILTYITPHLYHNFVFYPFLFEWKYWLIPLILFIYTVSFFKLFGVFLQKLEKKKLFILEYKLIPGTSCKLLNNYKYQKPVDQQQYWLHFCNEDG